MSAASQCSGIEHTTCLMSCLNVGVACSDSKSNRVYSGSSFYNTRPRLGAINRSRLFWGLWVVTLLFLSWLSAFSCWSILNNLQVLLYLSRSGIFHNSPARGFSWILDKALSFLRFTFQHSTFSTPFLIGAYCMLHLLRGARESTMLIHGWSGDATFIAIFGNDIETLEPFK